MITVNAYTINCCITDGVQNNIEHDVMSMDALQEIADENNKVDNKVIQFIYLSICI